jgi:hypothetical protein
VAMLSNLVLLPSLLLTLDKRVTKKQLNEPFLEIFDEEDDIDISSLKVENGEDDELKKTI